MPVNRFPDSTEKRELRRRDRRALEALCKRLGRRLDYCGMPSAEMLDIQEWQGALRSAVALEIDPEVAADITIQRDCLTLPVTVDVVVDDVLSYLQSAPQSFDLFNLDFYGGFLYPDKTKSSRSVDALRQLFARQAAARRSFDLVTTFNAREKGAAFYAEFIAKAKADLAGRPNAEANLAAHSKDQVSKLKLCFPFLCSHLAAAHGFDHSLVDATTYRSSATMVHFYQSFDYRSTNALPTSGVSALIAIANAPLYALDGQIRSIKLRPPSVGGV